MDIVVGSPQNSHIPQKNIIVKGGNKEQKLKSNVNDKKSKREMSKEIASTKQPDEIVLMGSANSDLFQKLTFIISKNSKKVNEFDILREQDKVLKIVSGDKYEFLFQPTNIIYVHIYGRLDPKGEINQLFPNEKYSSLDNPLLSDHIYNLSFPKHNNAGINTIYIVASSAPVVWLNNLENEDELIRELNIAKGNGANIYIRELNLKEED